MQDLNTGPVSELEFRAWLATPMAAVAITDRNVEVNQWCNEAFASAFKRTPDELAGAAVASYLPEAALRERRKLWQPMIERGERVEYTQVFGDQRVLTKCAPLDPGVKGPGMAVFGFFPEQIPSASAPPTLASTALLNELAILSPTELRVVHAFAKGWTREDIAHKLGRSPHTVQVHFRSIFAKLGIHREVELALRLGKSGLGSFSIDEWERIVRASASVSGGTALS